MPNLFPASHLDWTIDDTIDRLLAALPSARLQAATAALQDLYRGERNSAALAALDKNDMPLAYLAARLPTTFQTIRHVLAQLPNNFQPATQLDLGSGPGTAALAARDLWPDIQPHLIEREAAFAQIATTLLPDAALTCASLQDAAFTPADLVTLGYVINELAAGDITRLIEKAWAATRDCLVIVETGTPHGYAQLMVARQGLLRLGAQIIAPCPHLLACPLQSTSDWCHFALRVERSEPQRQAKGAPLPYEDEKFSYLIVRRTAAAPQHDRIIAAPRRAGGHVTLDLCQRDGKAAPVTVSKRAGAAYKTARSLMWGDEY